MSGDRWDREALGDTWTELKRHAVGMLLLRPRVTDFSGPPIRTCPFGNGRATAPHTCKPSIKQAGQSSNPSLRRSFSPHFHAAAEDLHLRKFQHQHLPLPLHRSTLHRSNLLPLHRSILHRSTLLPLHRSLCRYTLRSLRTHSTSTLQKIFSCESTPPNAYPCRLKQTTEADHRRTQLLHRSRLPKPNTEVLRDLGTLQPSCDLALSICAYEVNNLISL